MWNSSLDSVLLMFLSMSMSHYTFIVRCFLFSLSLFVSPASMKGFQVCTSCYRTAGWVTPGSHTESFEGYNLLVVVLLSFWFFGQISMSIKYVYLPLADLVFSSLRGIGSLEVCNSTDATRKNALKAGASGNASGGGILRGDKGPKTMPPLSVTLFCTIRERFVCCNCNSWSISYTRFGFNIHIFS